MRSGRELLIKRLPPPDTQTPESSGRPGRSPGIYYPEKTYKKKGYKDAPGGTKDSYWFTGFPGSGKRKV